MELLVQKQNWKDIFGKEYVCYLIYHKYGSVRLVITDDAYIVSLYVDENHRRKGIATQLMNRAEQIARDNGCKQTELTYNKRVAPTEVYEWYVRLGYKDKFIETDSITLVKDL